MATPVLNNGIFMRDTLWNATSHIDSYHMINMVKGSEPTDFGPIDIWAMTQKVEMPLYQMSSFNGKNVKMVDDLRGQYKWQTPVAQDLPYTIEDIEPSNTTKGIDGQAFRVKLNKREFGHGDIFTYDKYNGLEMYVTDDDILPIGDGYIYTVTLVNNSNTTFLDNKYLANGTKMFRVGSARGEYGERFSDIQINGGFREFYNYVGGSEAHVHYSVSSKAKMMIDLGARADGVIPVTEIWRNFDNNLDPSINSIEQVAATMGKNYVKKAVESGTLSRTFLTNLDKAHLTKVGKDIETYLMWGKGGRIRQDGPDDIRLSTGLWKQLDSAFKRVYNKSSFSLDMFRNEIYNFFAGRVEFEGPDPQRELYVQTGIGGMRMINEAIAREAGNSGLVIQAAENNGIGAITGKGMNLGYGFAYTSIVIPFLARIHFRINPAFDNVNTNDIENPIVDGNPLSSYSYIIFDVTDNTNDNIFLLKCSWDNQLKWFYQNGTMDYLGRTQGFQSSGMFNGFRVMMTQTMPAIWVKDPTKVLKIVMKNPITGGSL